MATNIFLNTTDLVMADMCGNAENMQFPDNIPAEKGAEVVDGLLITEAFGALHAALVEHASTKPIDVYRHYAPFMREIIKRNPEQAESAQECLNDIYLEQTRPDAELDNPDWIDPYTGQILPEEFYETVMEGLQHGKLSGAGNNSLGDSIAVRSLDVAKELHWDEKTRQKFVEGQSGFNGDADESTLHLDDRKYTPPTFLQKEDYQEQDDLDLAVAIKKINKVRGLTIGKMKRDNVPADEWKDEFAARMQAPIREFLRKVGKVEDDEAIQIELAATAMRSEKIDIAEAIEPVEFDESHVDNQDPALVDPTFDKELAATFDVNSKNPIQTPEFNMAKIAAVSAGASLVEANQTAWKAWRGRKSTIVSIIGNKSGLILNSGRQVSWHIATLKVKAHEIAITKDSQAKLLAKLLEIGVKNEFTELLGQ